MNTRIFSRRRSGQVTSVQPVSTSPDWRVIGDLVSTEMPVKLEWMNGRLSGSPEGMRAVDELLASGVTRVPVTPTGPWVDADRTDPLGAFVIACNVVRGADVTGTPPELPSAYVPPGAIA